MKLRVCYYTHRGYRPINEDALLIGGLVLQEQFMEEVECLSFEGGGLFAVADGLGGHVGGDIASRLLLEILAQLRPKTEQELLQALRKARDRLEDFVREKPVYSGLGTAVAGLLLLEERRLVFNVGDCRVYGIKEGKALRLTQDHSEAEELVRAGLLDPERAKHDPRRNFLTSAIIGSSNLRNFEVFMREVEHYGQYLICSDGVWEPLEEQELTLTPRAMAELLLEKGGDDNMSFVHISVEV